MGLHGDWDLVLHLPLRYEDQTRVTPIAQLAPGAQAQIEGAIRDCEVLVRGRRQLLVRIADDSGELLLRFLHFYRSQLRQLTAGRRIRAFGAVRGGLTGVEMVHPRVTPVEPGQALPQRLTPVYPAAQGVPQSWLRRRIERALHDVDLVDTVPAPVRARFRLPELQAALRELHGPGPASDRRALEQRRGPAWARVIFDELLAQQLSLQWARQRRRADTAPALRGAGALSEALLRALPFELTSAQRRVWREIEADLAQPAPMHRLVQGDVGSGKTVLAALAAARAIEAGQQAALMAPTELLAEQHFRRIVQWLQPLGVAVAWLVGRQGARERRATLEGIADGSAQLVVGTHALIQEPVRFARLGLAIVDEQHRFGVAQRLRLRQADMRAADAGAVRMPHLLMLSATPIPRTLAMSYFADLDVSVIDELPPGRRPVVTKLVAAGRKDEVLARIHAEVRRGRQVYWVCPLVEQADSGAATVPAARGRPGAGVGDARREWTAATRMYEHTRALLPDLRLGLLHGQLPAAEKTAVMQRFAAGAIDVLVATTVIEVGVDVPNATLMVVEHAERFGLAQLHQLRGRVGRGAEQSVCVLLYDEPLSEAARERLKVVYRTHDGFEIARADLRIRGPGEFVGARQSGLPLLRFADLERDSALLEAARECAAALLREDPRAARAHVERWLGARQTLLDA